MFFIFIYSLIKVELKASSNKKVSIFPIIELATTIITHDMFSSRRSSFFFLLLFIIYYYTTKIY